MTFFAARSSARGLALHVLLECRKKEAFVQELLDDNLRLSSLAPVDRRLATQLVFGVLRRRGTLDALLRPRVKRGAAPGGTVDLGNAAPGAYQLLLLTHIPPHAALNETVELAAAIGQPRAKGFINGVLRALLPLLTQEQAPGCAADALPLADGVFASSDVPRFPSQPLLL